MCGFQPANLSILSAKHLKIELKEHNRLRQERWQMEANALNVEDVSYAAKVGRVSIELFQHLAAKLMLRKPHTNDIQTFIDANFKSYLNTIYRNRNAAESPARQLADINRRSFHERCRTLSSNGPAITRVQYFIGWHWILRSQILSQIIGNSRRQTHLES